MEECIFCRIVKNSLPSSVVYSDKEVLAFMDVNPINTGHILVIPKTHYTNLSELNSSIGGQIFRVAMQMAKSLRKTNIRCEGITLLLADGEAASQEILHVHLHVIPRFLGDDFKILGFKKDKQPDRKALDETAIKIALARAHAFLI